MKKIIFSLVTLSVLVFACKSEQKDEPLENPEATSSTIVEKATLNLAVEGMVCAVGCAKGIESKLTEMTGISSCKVDYEGKTAVVEYDKATVTEDMIISTIQKMNDGQYKTSKVLEKADNESSSSSTEAQVSGFNAPSFDIPQILTYLVNII